MHSKNLKDDFKIEFISIIIIFILTSIATLLGIINGSFFYESQYIGNLATDWTTVLIILPLIIVTLFFSRKNNLLAILFLPGMLFYLVFVYFFYSIAVPFNWNFLLYIVITPLSGLTALSIIYKIDSDKVYEIYYSHIPSKFVGGLLILFGGLFLFLDIGDIINTLLQESNVTIITYTPWIVDFLFGIPIAIAGGILLLKKNKLGYVLGPGLLLYFIVLDFGVSILYVFYWYYNVPDFSFDAMIIFTVITLICLYPLRYFIKVEKGI